uniref:S5A_REDUCTASE domain-containing protein n=1 Tax=Ascaris lumbricoides TaxID=6252 RepID=A0A0M3II07_ASCLU
MCSNLTRSTLIGLTLFALGAFVNVQSDSILRNLRRPGERGYKIPRGGLFEYVSGANYLGECVEWIGYALCARTLPSFAFAIFTLCNIGPRAVHHHRQKHNLVAHPSAVSDSQKGPNGPELFLVATENGIL